MDEVFMKTIGFIGLGIMGSPMAAQLVAAGFAVNGHTRSRPGLDRLTAAGGRAATSVAEAVTGADVVITMLPDSPDVEAVLLGAGGVFAHAAPGTLIIDMSTISPRASRHLAAAGAAFRMLDAPVFGGERG